MNVTVDGDQPGWLLHQAAIYDNVELMRSLLEGPEKHNINCQDSSGRTPLYTSVSNNSLNCCHLLLNNGADANLPCGGLTPLHNSASRNNILISKLLLEQGADIHRRDASGKRPIELAEANRSLDCVNAIREKMESERQQKERLQKELIESCLHCDTEKAKLISNDPSFTLQEVLTIVHNYRMDGLDLLYRACDQGSESMCEFLLQTGAAITPNTKNGQNAFHVSCLLGQINCAQLLLQQNPNLVNMTTFEGSLPLHLACLLGQIDIVKFLLSHSAKHQLNQTSSINLTSDSVEAMVNARDALGQMPLHIAVANRHIALVQYFLRGRLVINSEDSRRSSDSDIGSEILLTMSDDASIDTDNHGSTSSSIELEILFSVDVDADDVDGKTPFHLAVLGDGKVSYNDIISILLQHNANSNRAMTLTHGSTTALMEAVQRSDLVLIDLLLSHGAKDDQMRVLKTAVMLQDDRMISCLIKHHTYLDSEYKVSQKRLSGFFRTGDLAVDPSFPALDALAVMICWHGLALQKILQLWIEVACDHHIRHRLPNQLSAFNEHPAFSLLFITRVDISGNSLSILPNFLFLLPSLKILNASLNQIRAIAKVSKSGMLDKDVLTNLPVDFQCEDFDYDLETDCPLLEELDLQKNQLLILPTALFKLPSLKRLNASNNLIRSLPFEMWTSSSLVELNLSNNQLDNLPYCPDDSFYECCDQTDIALTGFSPDSVKAFGCKVTMSSSAAEISDALLVGEQVDSQKEYTAIPTTYINCWQERMQVELSSSSQELESKMEQHTQLKELVLSGNLFEEVPYGLPCLAPGLEKLSLAHNRLKEVGSPSLYPARLKSLDLSHNLISCDVSLVRVRRSIPIATRSCVSPNVQLSSPCFSPFHSRSFSPAMNLSASNPMLRKFSSSTLSSSSPTLSSLVFTPLVCPHRLHQQFIRLKSLKLDSNQLTKFSVRHDAGIDVDAQFNVTKEGSLKTNLSFEYPLSRGRPMSQRDKNPLKFERLEKKDSSDFLLYPNLILLDLSNNEMNTLSADISDLTHLAELKISSNKIKELPPEMGLLKKLWFLDFSGCPVEATLRSLLGKKISRTLTVLSYLKSVREEAKPFNRMKLMLVGKQGIGKTSLLGHLRYYAGDRNKFTHWAQRMGHEMKDKDLKGENISTVGVDIGTFEIQRGNEKVVFSTWDFGGQREYYATHQYFLSKRSLYCVVWKVTDGEEGVNEILRWLINIQARAPNSPVIIVGTHRDALRKSFHRARLDELGELIERKYIQVADPDKLGLPRVMGHLEVSCKGGLMSRTYISQLVDMIWKVANEEQQPGNPGTRLLDQLVPSSYLHLQDAVMKLAEERKREGKDPVLYAGQYKHLVIGKMEEMFGVSFQDISELNQATQFLHENGILLHYEDINLRDIYFLDPQWLCDMLASVITIREINGLVRSGLMMVDDLKLLFKRISFKSRDIRLYIVDLLQKFEVALLCNESSLVIPSLLPIDRDLVMGYPGQRDVTIPVQGSGRDVSGRFLSSENSKQMPCYANGDNSLTQNHSCSSSSDCQQTVTDCEITSKNKSATDGTQTGCQFVLRNIVNPVISVVRLYVMSYFPSGFWPRLITRLLGDSHFYGMLKALYNFSILPMSFDELTSNARMVPRWRCWQTGTQLQLFGLNVLQIKEVTDFSRGLFDYRLYDLAIKPEDQTSWSSINTSGLSILEILIHNETLEVEIDSEISSNVNGSKSRQKHILYPDSKVVALLMTRVVECVDLLLEDWYPDIGIRLTQNTRGMYLITRLVPCTRCFLEHSDLVMEALSDEVWSVVDSRKSSCDDLDCASESKSLSCNVVMHLSHPERVGRTLSNSRLQGISERNCLKDSVRSFSCDRDFRRGPTNNGPMEDSSRETEKEAKYGDEVYSCRTVHCYTVEQCLQIAQLNRVVFCPCHGNLGPFFVASSTGLVYSGHVAPDTVFHDISDNFLVDSDSIILKTFLGKGAFGAVYSGSIIHKHSDDVIPVAFKMLQPVKPPDGATYSQKQLFDIEKVRWDKDPLKNCCEAYCNARKELGILLMLKHEHMVPLVGVSVSPLCLVLSLAPHGALSTWLKNYSNAGAKLLVTTVHQIIFQVSTALEYLHSHQVIYRDLKSDNVLVWSLPPPHSTGPLHPVNVKLADYGVSRVVLPFGTKGFAGTLAFMAPEIMQHGGEETYTEKVDCFSFGMFMYELILLRPPYDETGDAPGSNINIKGHVLAGGRPTITSKEIGLPSNILDLMTLCWSSDPSDRPSAAEIVTFLSSIEFSSLCNAVMLDEDHQDVVCCCSALRPLTFGDQKTDGFLVLNGMDRGVQCDVWMSTQGLASSSGSLLVNTYEGQDCVESKKINFDFDSVLTCMCVTETDVWCSCSLAKIHVFRRLDYRHVLSFLASSGSREIVRCMVYGKTEQQVYVALETGHLVVYSDVKNIEALPKSIEYPGSEEPVFSMTSVQNLRSEVWCGQSRGRIQIWRFRVGAVCLSALIHTKEDENLSDTSQLVNSCSDFDVIWSYVSPVVFRWSVKNRSKTGQIDLTQIQVPYIDQVLANPLQSLSSIGLYLYIGTTYGLLIIIDAKSLNIVNICRNHEHPIHAVLPLSVDSASGRNPEHKEIGWADRSQFFHTSSLLATIGKGYRDLVRTVLKRYHREKSNLCDRLFILTWNGDQWLNVHGKQSFSTLR